MSRRGGGWGNPGRDGPARAGVERTAGPLVQWVVGLQPLTGLPAEAQQPWVWPGKAKHCLFGPNLSVAPSDPGRITVPVWA